MEKGKDMAVVEKIDESFFVNEEAASRRKDEEEQTRLRSFQTDISFAEFGNSQVSRLEPEGEAAEVGQSNILWALLWKNWLIKKRRWKTSCLELAVPLFFVILLAFVKSFTDVTVIETGWSTDLAQFCPYTGETADSAVDVVACNLPFNAFYRSSSSFLEITSVISQPTEALFFTFESDREREVVEDFIRWTTEIGTAETGPIQGFRNMTTIFGDGSVKALTDYARSRDYGRPFSTERPKITLAVSLNVMDFENANFDYTLRLNSSSINGIRSPDSSLPPNNPLQRGIRFGNLSPGGEYISRGFVALQILLDSYIIQRSGDFFEFSNRDSFDSQEEFSRTRELFEPANVAALPFPIPEYTQDVFFVVNAQLFPLIFVIMYLSPASQIVSVIVLEKEVRAREMLRLMGVPDYKIIFSWYLVYVVFFFFLGMLIASFGGSIFPETTDAAGGFSWVLVVIFFLFGMTTTAFSFVVSTLFQTGLNGIVACLMVFLMLFFTFYSFDGTSSDGTVNAPFVAFLIPQVAFGFIIKTLTTLEAAAMGLSWELTALEIDNFSVLEGLLYLVIDFIYLTLLGFYFNAVVPGEFGTPLPFYFPVQKSFYMRKYNDFMMRRRAHKETTIDLKVLAGGVSTRNHFARLRHLTGETIEKINDNLSGQVYDGVGLQVRGLTKKFKTPDGVKTAVNEFNLDAFEGEILVLLGHNGAGKTTLLSILSGSLTPSDGDAMIYGKLITQDISKIRRQLRFCPQKDILYPNLTVHEHLQFYGKLKGYAGEQLVAVVRKSIENVGLTEKVDTISKSLSGGMKRKLSLAISLLGDSKVIFIDEPTSGVDTFSRRSIWQSIQNCREGRVIILTTHFMDEADILSDRLAIMAEGKLQCCGSSLFLKQLYGAGYQLTCVRVSDEDFSTKLTKTKSIVLDYIPGSSVVSDIGTELSFYLPVKEARLFPKLFDKLDSLINSRGLDIYTYGVSVTTMEEVFLKAGQSDDLLQGAKELQRQTSARSFVALNEEQILEDETSEPAKELHKKYIKSRFSTAGGIFNNIFLQQFYGLFVKRANYSKRDSYSFLCNTLVPVSILAVGLTVLKIARQLTDPPPLVLSPKDWNPAFPRTERAIIPVVEFDLDGSFLPSENAVVLTQEHFAAFTLRDPVIDADVTDENRTVFQQLCFVEPEFRFGYTLLVNSTAAHAVPIAVLEINQALLRSSLSNASLGNLEPAIKVTTHPLPKTSQRQEVFQGVIAFITAVFAVLAFAFVTAPMVSYAVLEKEEGVQIKHLQFVSGTNIGIYWLASYAFDLIVYHVPFFLALVLIQLFNIESFTENGAFGVVAIVFLGYGWAVIPFSYLVSHFFKEHTNALIGIIIINCLTGVILMVSSFAMDQIPDTQEVNSSLKKFYRIFPGFCLGDSLLQIAKTNLLLGILDSSDGVPGLYDFDVTGANITYLFVEGVVFFFLVIVVEYAKTNMGRIEKMKASVFSLFRNEKRYRSTTILDSENPFQDNDAANIDGDVKAEEKLVASKVNIDSDVIRLEKLRKVYPGGKVAVRGVSLGIPAGMCFGYLGINGAGKTTTLKCLTGDISPTGGTASIQGFDIITDQTNVRKNVGYCSQFSSILGLLTVREHLELFCRIKYNTLSFSDDFDMSGGLIEHTVQKLLKRLSLNPFENKLSKSLSGGNKRKLSVAIAMIGSPSVMLLDEPSTGMDVASRRFMWDVIENMVAGKYDGKKTSVILTTHSMEECEALCSRVGIMVGGRLRCLGGIQHLKSKFGNGFTIETRLDFITKEETASLIKTSLGKLCVKGYIPISRLYKACFRLGGREIFKALVKNERGSAWAILQKLVDSSSIERKRFRIEAETFVEWFLQQQRLLEVKKFLEHSFPENLVEVVEAHEYHVVFKINKTAENDVALSLGRLFDIFEKNKLDLKISEYSVSQTTLEQIFNMFASQQEEEKGIARGMAGAEENLETLSAKEKIVRELLIAQPEALL
eukprot:maker-scaffold_17-snap-gene-6.71-mRNA-1 protein AED:0.02 eAED:0.02 QI:0/0.33/0.25/1/0.66/0.5/4/146/1967